MYCKICGKVIPEKRLQQGKQTCCRSCASKDSWNNPNTRNNRLNGIQKYYKQPGIHDKLSVKAKLAYQNPIARQNISNAVKAYYAKEGSREKTSMAVKAAMARPEVRQKLKKILNTPEVKQKMRAASKLIANNPDIRQKQYDTKRKHNSFNSSKSEQYIKELLQSIFSDIRCQHYSNVYPFLCDFYIPSLDLYIELNFHWTHGNRPFDENDESCIEQLNIWKEKAKTSKFYQNAIYTWTIRDIEKFKITKQNNLNYLVFYNWQQFEQWFNFIKVFNQENSLC